MEPKKLTDETRLTNVQKTKKQPDRCTIFVKIILENIVLYVIAIYELRLVTNIFLRNLFIRVHKALKQTKKQLTAMTSWLRKIIWNNKFITCEKNYSKLSKKESKQKARYMPIKWTKSYITPLKGVKPKSQKWNEYFNGKTVISSITISRKRLIILLPNREIIFTAYPYMFSNSSLNVNQWNWICHIPHYIKSNESKLTTIRVWFIKWVSSKQKYSKVLRYLLFIQNIHSVHLKLLYS